MAVAMRTNNYFELRNREMGFYTELRIAIILACINVDRTVWQLLRERPIRLASPRVMVTNNRRKNNIILPDLHYICAILQRLFIVNITYPVETGNDYVNGGKFSTITSVRGTLPKLRIQQFLHRISPRYRQ